MLRCGDGWQPTRIKRVIEGYETSTRVAKVATDAGNGFLKGMGNPAGELALATELVAGELAAWYGLQVPPFAIVGVLDIEIPMIGRGNMRFGPGFISREIEGAPSDGADIFLKKINNPDDVSKIVFFDTWIRNADRWPPEAANLPGNRDNLFFTPVDRKFDLVALDHSHCFVETTLADELSSPHLLEDDGVYGNYPEFRPLITAQAVAAAATRLRQIDISIVREIVESIPPEWGVTVGERRGLADLICRRALRVADYLPAKLVAQPSLEL